MTQEVLCPICGSAMELKVENFSIGADGGGGLFAALIYEQYSVDLYACPQCGKVELYTAGFQKPEPEMKKAEAEPEAEPAPEEPASQSSGMFGFGKREKDKRPPWER